MLSGFGSEEKPVGFTLEEWILPRLISQVGVLHTGKDILKI
jgi:hypothetical protein